jgi:hypothetical protein
MRGEHPDAVMVASMIGDLTAWLQEPASEPTSQITGGGAVRTAEERFADLHAGRRSLLLPSASYGMRAALLAAGVRPGSRVLIPGVDWGSTLSAVRSVGAIAVPIPVDAATMTLDPAFAARQMDAATDAIVVCHLHGVPADVPGLRAIVPAAVPIIEDCAQALGSMLDGQLVGTLGDLAVFSFGPSKAIEVGEAAIVVCGTEDLYDRLIGLTAHPARQMLNGRLLPKFAEFSMRVTPGCAIRLARALGSWQPGEYHERHARLRATIEAYRGVTVVGGDIRRTSAAARVPMLCGADTGSKLPVDTVASAAMNIEQLLHGLVETTTVMLAVANPQGCLTESDPDIGGR